MDAKEIRELSSVEIRTKVDQSHEELRNLRFQRAVGQLTDLSRMRHIKRDIARMETILRERELAAANPATPEEE